MFGKQVFAERLGNNDREDFDQTGLASSDFLRGCYLVHILMSSGVLPEQLLYLNSSWTTREIGKELFRHLTGLDCFVIQNPLYAKVAHLGATYPLAPTASPK